jgi:lipid II:glycine glycyltransferase (peptidoglycan interpeptide bridge formation enzyme)
VPHHGVPRGTLAVTVEADPGEARLRVWDELVRASARDVAQLSGWARVRRLAGYQALYVFVEDGGELVGGAQVLVRRLPVLGAVCYVPYGPVALPSAVRPAVQESLAEALARVGRRSSRALFVQPPDGADAASAALRRHGFRRSDANIAPSVSLRVDLAADNAQLRRNLSRSLRGSTNQWAARGVTVRIGGEQDLPVAAELHARTARHHGFSAFPLEYLTAMYRELATGDHVLLLIGEVHGRPGAMGLYTGIGGVLKSRLVGLDRSSEAARYDTVAAVDWRALSWAKQNGYRWFDFSGVSPASLDGRVPAGRDLVSGPDRYKLRFGGVPYGYPQPVELIASRIVRRGYDVVRRSSSGREMVSALRDRARTGPSRSAVLHRSEAGTGEVHDR